MRYLLFTLLACQSVGALAQPNLPPGVRGAESGMATRSVAAYLTLERGLVDALVEGNRDAVLRKLSEGFEIRSAGESEGIAAAAWLQSELSRPIESASVRNLSVREFGDIAVVSFLLDSRRMIKNKKVTSTLYVIDIWRQTPPQLVTRYVSIPRRTSPIPMRPSGRE